MSKNNAKSMIVLLILTVFTKALGFLKTAVTAAYFGMSVQTDIYNIADGIINQVFYAFTISVSVIIVPLYLARKEESDSAGKRFARTAYVAMALLGGALMLLVFFLSPTIARVMGREYEPVYIELLSQYMRVLATGIMLTLVTNTIQSILNAERVYGFPSVCAMMHSVILIVFAVLFANTLGVWALVLSVPVAYLVQTVFLRVKARKYLDVSLRKTGYDRGIKTLFVSMIPVFLSNATMELNGFVDKYLLAGLEAGAVTAVSYAMVLLVFATNIISIPITTVLFTDVSELCSRKQYDQVRGITEKAVTSVLLLCLPIMVIAISCADKIVSFVYGYGNFSPEAVQLTAASLAGYGFSIVSYVLKDVINRVSYALLETKLPMIVGVFSVAVHIGVAVLLTPYMGMMGVIWGTVASVGMTAVLTLLILSKKYLHCRWGQFKGSILKIALAAAAMVGIIALLEGRLHMGLFGDKINTFLDLVVYTLIGFVVYFGMLLAAREETMTELCAGALKKIRQK